MPYVLLFLEGIITFISPCLLPLLPVYVSYFAAGEGKTNTLLNSIGFVIGFTVVFVAMGAFAGTVGGFFISHTRIISIIGGIIIVVLGLNYVGVVNLRVFRAGTFGKFQLGKTRPSSFPSAIVFGIVLSIAWTPCVSTFLGAALVRAAAQGSAHEGMLMLLVYSLGLGLPFIASAVLIDKLKGAFDFLKRNYRAVNIFSGAVLVLVGILMILGRLW
ncbi:MAG: cytochrome c biogenesis CcdA family protein [Defluviitaleaceae bacterium]|nr:cytochrome c biogenesis CcdA family protein [Defluviitaleaceae bacterium]MCL2264383.1 cytochrome c biogenesis CcdA family protein [Defluviitaleaceae bacterium]